MPLALPPPDVVQVVSFTLERLGRVYRVSDARLEAVSVSDCNCVALDSDMADDAALMAAQLVGDDREVVDVLGCVDDDGTVRACAILANVSQ